MLAMNLLLLSSSSLLLIFAFSKDSLLTYETERRSGVRAGVVAGRGMSGRLNSLEEKIYRILCRSRNLSEAQ